MPLSPVAPQGLRVPGASPCGNRAFPPPPPAGDRGSPGFTSLPPQLKAKSLLLLNTKANRSPPPHSQNTFIALKTAFINKHTGERLRTRNTKMSNGAGHVRRAPTRRASRGASAKHSPSVYLPRACGGPSGLGQRGGGGHSKGPPLQGPQILKVQRGTRAFPGDGGNHPSPSAIWKPSQEDKA